MDKLYWAHPTAVIDDGADIGRDTKIWHFTHVSGTSVIGDECSFGQNVYVAPDVRVGHRVKVQNGVSLYTGVFVDDYCFIGPNATFTNDRHPRAWGYWKLEPTYLRRGASVGANATILCGLTLGEFCMVGCGAVVTKNVAPRTLVQGNPARAVKTFEWSELEVNFPFLIEERASRA